MFQPGVLTWHAHPKACMRAAFAQSASPQGKCTQPRYLLHGCLPPCMPTMLCSGFLQLKCLECLTIDTCIHHASNARLWANRTSHHTGFAVMLHMSTLPRELLPLLAHTNACDGKNREGACHVSGLQMLDCPDGTYVTTASALLFTLPSGIDALVFRSSNHNLPQLTFIHLLFLKATGFISAQGHDQTCHSACCRYTQSYCAECLGLWCLQLCHRSNGPAARKCSSSNSVL